MLKKTVLFLIPVLLLVIVFVPIMNNLVYWSLYAVLFALVLIFWLLEDTVPDRSISAYLKGADYWSIKAGVIKNNGQTAEIIGGCLVISGGRLYFMKRKGGKAGVEVLREVPVSSITGYTLKKVDGYHDGIAFTLESDDEILFVSRSIAKEEKALLKALEWE